MGLVSAREVDTDTMRNISDIPCFVKENLGKYMN
jgi:hypothetical protein